MKPPRKAPKKAKSNTNAVIPSTKTRTYKIAHGNPDEAARYIQIHRHSKEEIMAYGLAFVDWAKEELDNPYSRRLTFAKFWLINDIHYATAWEWTQKYPEFKEYWDKAVALIGIKREDGMLMRELSEKAVMFNQHHYLDYHKASDKYHADLRKTEEQNNSGKVLYKLVELTDV